MLEPLVNFDGYNSRDGAYTSAYKLHLLESFERSVDLDIALQSAELVLEAGVHGNFFTILLCLSNQSDITPGSLTTQVQRTSSGGAIQSEGLGIMHQPERTLVELKLQVLSKLEHVAVLHSLQATMYSIGSCVFVMSTPVQYIMLVYLQ